jgi:hypothetical protein
MRAIMLPKASMNFMSRLATVRMIFPLDLQQKNRPGVSFAQRADQSDQISRQQALCFRGGTRFWIEA